MTVRSVDSMPTEEREARRKAHGVSNATYRAVMRAIARMHGETRSGKYWVAILACGHVEWWSKRQDPVPHVGDLRPCRECTTRAAG